MATQYEQAQRDLWHAINKQGGMEKVTLSDDSLRPLALKLVDYGKANGHMLAAFDWNRGDRTVERIYLGFITQLTDAVKLDQAIQAAARVDGLIDLLKASSPVVRVAGGGRAAVFFEKLFIPAEALHSRRH